MKKKEKLTKSKKEIQQTMAIQKRPKLSLETKNLAEAFSRLGVAVKKAKPILLQLNEDLKPLKP